MGIRVRFQGGPRSGQVLEFGNEIQSVVFGRDPGRCNVVLPEEENSPVGREHCALRRELGRYRLVLNRDNPVYVGGELAHDDQEIEAAAEIQLGADGPRFVVETTGDVRLGKTRPAAGRPPGTHTLLARVGRSARRNRWMTAGLALALVVAAYQIYRTMEGVERLSVAQTQLVNSVSDVKKLGPGMREVLAKASPSVLLVAQRGADGGTDGVGTAWVVGPGMLATNAHVAAAFEELEDGDSLVARTNSIPPREFVIRRAEPHPGFARFQAIWTQHHPIAQGREGIEDLSSPGACDVALLHVDPSSDLPPPLPLASQAELDALRVGDVLGLVGYPMERVASGAIMPTQPSPTSQIGHLVALSDFFLIRSPGAQRVIQHSMGSAGGASGSPILNADGKVIALHNAANYAFTQLDGRISSDSGISYAQRVDLLRALVEGKATEQLQTLEAEWRDTMTGLPSASALARKEASESRDKIVQHIVEGWLSHVGASRAEQIVDTSGVFDAQRDDAWVHTHVFEPEKPGSYLAIATSDGEDIDLGVFEADGDTLLGKDEEAEWYAFVDVDVEKTRPLSLLLLGYGTEPPPFKIEIYRAADGTKEGGDDKP